MPYILCTSPTFHAPMIRVAVVQFSPVQGHISLNLEPDFGSSSQILVNLNLNLREPDFRSSLGSSIV